MISFLWGIYYQKALLQFHYKFYEIREQKASKPLRVQGEEKYPYVCLFKGRAQVNKFEKVHVVGGSPCVSGVIAHADGWIASTERLSCVLKAFGLHSHDSHDHEGEGGIHVEPYFWKALLIVGGIYLFFLIETILSYFGGSHHHHHHAVSLNCLRLADVLPYFLQKHVKCSIPVNRSCNMPEQVADTEFPAEPPSENMIKVLPKFLQFEKKSGSGLMELAGCQSS